METSLTTTHAKPHALTKQNHEDLARARAELAKRSETFLAVYDALFTHEYQTTAQIAECVGHGKSANNISGILCKLRNEGYAISDLRHNGRRGRRALWMKPPAGRLIVPQKPHKRMPCKAARKTASTEELFDSLLSHCDALLTAVLELRERVMEDAAKQDRLEKIAELVKAL